MEDGQEEVKRKRPRKQTNVEAESKIVKDNEPAPDQEVLEPEKPVKTNDRLYRVYIKGKERHLTETAIKVASKDKKLNLQIPEDSKFKAPQFKKCKDC